MGVVIALMQRLGVTHPSEQTIKWLIALLATEHFIVNLKTFPPYADLFGFVLLAKSKFTRTKGPSHLVNYPTTPQELFEERYNAGYQDPEDGPVSHMPIDFISTGCKHIPLRKIRNCSLVVLMQSPV